MMYGYKKDQVNPSEAKRLENLSLLQSNNG